MESRQHEKTCIRWRQRIVYIGIVLYLLLLPLFVVVIGFVIASEAIVVITVIGVGPGWFVTLNDPSFHLVIWPLEV